MPEILHHAPVPFNGAEIHTLPNGLKVLLKEDHTVPVVSMQVWVNCGAIHETPRIAGISHGLEHMVFKGTPKRSAGEVTRAVESNGGIINAATQIETTYYYIDIPSYGAQKALDILADTLTHPSFPQEELERERLVILEEIKRRDDHPNSTLWDEFAANIFNGTPYGSRIIGSIETVSALSREDLVQYFSSHYVPEKMSLVLVGDFKKKKILNQVNRLFGQIPSKKAPAPPGFRHDSLKAQSVVIKKPFQLAHMAMGIPTVGMMDEDVVKLDILSDALGGGISCRLFQRLREEKKIALSVASDYIAYQERGVFSFFAESFPDKAEEVKEKISLEVNNLKKEPLTQGELDRAKSRIKSGWLHDAETYQERASTLGSFHSSRRLDLLCSYLGEVEKITLEDLEEVWEKHIFEKPIFTTEVRPG